MNEKQKAGVDVLAVMGQRRSAFRDAAMRNAYDASVSAYREKGPAYMDEGNSAAGMFRRGFTGKHVGAWDTASRKTLAYAQFRAGQDCAKDEARAAVAELIEAAKSLDELLAGYVAKGPTGRRFRAALARVQGGAR